MSSPDISSMLINEVRRIEHAVVQRKALLAKLEQQMRDQGDGVLNLERERPQRYSVEFSFVPGDLQPQERSFLVEGGTLFKCNQLESSFRVVGAAAVDDGGGGTLAGQNAQVTLPWAPVTGNRPSARQAYFDYLWRVRDTGSDRDWQNSNQPSIFMLTGSLMPVVLPVRARIVGGSEVFVTIDPFFSRSVFGSNVGLFFTVSQYIVHVSFFGTEVAR